MFAYKTLVGMQSEVPYMGTRFVYYIFTLITTYADRFFVDVASALLLGLRIPFDGLLSFDMFPSI